MTALHTLSLLRASNGARRFVPQSDTELPTHARFSAPWTSNDLRPTTPGPKAPPRGVGAAIETLHVDGGSCHMFALIVELTFVQ